MNGRNECDHCYRNYDNGTVHKCSPIDIAVAAEEDRVEQEKDRAAVRALVDMVQSGECHRTGDLEQTREWGALLERMKGWE